MTTPGQDEELGYGAVVSEGRNTLQSNLTDDLDCYACGEPWSIPDHVEVWWEDDDPRMKLHCSRSTQQGWTVNDLDQGTKVTA